MVLYYCDVISFGKALIKRVRPTRADADTQWKAGQIIGKYSTCFTDMIATGCLLFAFSAISGKAKRKYTVH